MEENKNELFPYFEVFFCVCIFYMYIAAINIPMFVLGNAQKKFFAFSGKKTYFDIIEPGFKLAEVPKKLIQIIKDF